jgi:putative PIN family toxin of toxin-antitoxin system
MTRVVLDSNVYISAICFNGLPAEIIRLAITGRFKVFISREIVVEVIGVLSKKFDYPKEALEEIEDLLLQTGELIEPKQTVKVIKGWPADNRILECGLACRADLIVTGDKKHLLPLKTHRKIKIVSPKEFLKIVEG